ncbi:MAG TPA: cupin domain-containing protein [Candidatus Saccharimonadia bacterium]|nr:cupin domain-containing protein [Candidatus Saccharimonadia bacterium]
MPAPRPRGRSSTPSRGLRIKRSLPIEIDASGKPPLGMSPARFLRSYWQKRPLLVRGAFARFESPVSPDELAGLACEPVASSRLVVHDPRRDRYALEHGPFEEARFATLPKNGWSLLVQDCDKLLAEVDAILAHFRFVPDWRVDDVMISYATDGGSVGAHVDRYDVFLLQATGRRRWRIATSPDAPTAFRDDSELKLLRRFEPDHDWVLEPGDMLYLPPGIPHHGIAVGECTTWSIGMRAPSLAEMLVDYAEYVAERTDDAQRYADPALAPPRDPSRIGDDALARVMRALRSGYALDRATVAAWFAGFITRYRSAHAVAPAEQSTSAAGLARLLARGARLHRSPWSRLATQRDGTHTHVVLAGDAYRTSARLARVLGAAKRYDRSALADASAADLAALAAMVDAGHLVIERD